VREIAIAEIEGTRARLEKEPPMLRIALILAVIGFALPAIAQDRGAQLPENTIDCNQFEKTGFQEWMEVGTAVFDLGKVKDINLTNQPITPGFFKFGGIDVYPVLDQKCGVVTKVASNSTAQAPITLEQGTVPKAELEQDKSSSASAQIPAQSNLNELVPPSEDKIVNSQPESMPCGERKSVYVADGFTETAGGKTIVEIVFKNKMDGEENSEFIIREYKNNDVEWAYKGKNRQGRFIFTKVTSRQRNNLGFIFTSMRFEKQESVGLVPIFVKPNRFGKGEAILYVSGLRELFASKENIRRFKFEGKRPSESLPETFYFDRCE
jgi:hypothetical protein